MKTLIDGIKVTEILITPTCRKNRTIDGALNEAFRITKEKYEETTQFKANNNATYHLVLTVDRPKE